MSSNGHTQELDNIQIPQSWEAEQAVLGSVLIHEQVFAQLIPIITRRDFYYLRHRYIWEVMESLWERHESIDYLTVNTELKAIGKLDEIGGPAFITGLINDTPTALHAPVYANIIQSAAIRRRLLEATDDIRKAAIDGSIRIEQVAEAAQREIFNVTDIRDDRTMATIREMASAHYDKIDQLQSGVTFGIPSGFKGLDNLLMGLKRKKLYIIAARPGMGKTAMLQTTALHAARLDQRILFLSMEMSLDEVMDRFIAIETGINLQKLASGLTAEESARYVAALDRVSALPIVVDEKARQSPTTIRAKVERVMQSMGIDLLMVDYLQLAKGDDGKRYGTQEQEIADISSSLKELAKDFNIPVLCAAQFNRNASGRADRTPILEDLRGSGQIEQDADVVIFLHSDDYYLPKQEQPTDFEVQVIVGKNRSGPMGDVPMVFRRGITKYVER